MQEWKNRVPKTIYKLDPIEGCQRGNFSIFLATDAVETQNDHREKETK